MDDAFSFHVWYESSHISFLNVRKKSVAGIFQYGWGDRFYGFF